MKYCVLTVVDTETVTYYTHVFRYLDKKVSADNPHGQFLNLNIYIEIITCMYVAAVAHRKSLPAHFFLMKNNVFCVFFPGQMQLHHQLVQLQP